MASTKEYRDFILEQLSEVPDVTCRPMMGEFLLYSSGILFGGIYDDRLLVKIVPENEQYKIPESIPYDGAKPMYLVEEVDNKDKLAKIIKDTTRGLLNKK
ncbi:TfoX/Sxy family protein [Candidatus Saccharibacteria bacterium]|nr:TfoX/Sxy family protein [Candidatus Saccharibacteria bacterium]